MVIELLNAEGSTTRNRCPEPRRCHVMRQMQTFSAIKMRGLGE
jgi:hypothetical protein